VPPRQLKNRAAPTQETGAARSKAAAIGSWARSAKINPFSTNTSAGNSDQNTKLRLRRHNSCKIRRAIASACRLINRSAIGVTGENRVLESLIILLIVLKDHPKNSVEPLKS
jgi:hypothetical protein